MTVTPTVGETYTVEHSDEFNKPNREYEVTVTMVRDNYVRVVAEAEVVAEQVRCARKSMRKGCGRENTNENYRFVQVDHAGNVDPSCSDNYCPMENFNEAIVK